MLYMNRAPYWRKMATRKLILHQKNRYLSFAITQFLLSKIFWVHRSALFLLMRLIEPSDRLPLIEDQKPLWAANVDQLEHLVKRYLLLVVVGRSRMHLKQKATPV